MKLKFKFEENDTRIDVKLLFRDALYEFIRTRSKTVHYVEKRHNLWETSIRKDNKVKEVRGRVDAAQQILESMQVCEEVIKVTCGECGVPQFQLLELQEYTCMYCGIKGEPCDFPDYQY